MDEYLGLIADQVSYFVTEHEDVIESFEINNHDNEKLPYIEVRFRTEHFVISRTFFKEDLDNMKDTKAFITQEFNNIISDLEKANIHKN